MSSTYPESVRAAPTNGTDRRPVIHAAWPDHADDPKVSVSETVRGADDADAFAARVLRAPDQHARTVASSQGFPAAARASPRARREARAGAVPRRRCRRAVTGSRPRRRRKTPSARCGRGRRRLAASSASIRASFSPRPGASNVAAYQPRAEPRAAETVVEVARLPTRSDPGSVAVSSWRIFLYTLPAPVMTISTTESGWSLYELDTLHHCCLDRRSASDR